jgi:hypothetical protein
MRRIICVIGAAAVVISSFFITLWLTEPEMPPMPQKAADDRSNKERLATQRVSINSDLAKAAQNVGLRRSGQMKGTIDVVRRISDQEVHMEGWLADPQGGSAPLSVLVFTGGKMVAATQTKGERPDVTNAIHLGFGSEQNVVFSFNFECPAGSQPVVVGLAKEINIFPSNPKNVPEQGRRGRKCPVDTSEQGVDDLRTG